MKYETPDASALAKRIAGEIVERIDTSSLDATC
jgi:hypothetical protein